MGERQAILDGQWVEQSPKRLETMVQFQVRNHWVWGMVYSLNGMEEPASFEGLDGLVLELERRYVREDRHTGITRPIHCEDRDASPALQSACITVMYREGYTLQGELRSVKGKAYFRSALELIHLFQELTQDK